MDENEFRIEWIKLCIHEIVEASKSHSSAVLAFALAAMRGAFLLNGSAAVAVVAKEGGDISGPGALILLWGALGAGFAVLSAGASYVSQRLYHNALMQSARTQMQILMSGQLGRIIQTPPPVAGHIFSTLACLLFIASVSVFS